jgi:hypothetical protein
LLRAWRDGRAASVRRLRCPAWCEVVRPGVRCPAAPGSPWSRRLAAGSRQRAIEFGTRGGGTARRFRRAAWLCACAGSSRRREGKACGQRRAAAGRLPHAAARTAAARRDGTCPAVMRASHIWPVVITAHSQRSSARGAGLPVSEPAGVPAGPAGVLGCWLPGRSGPARDSDRRPRRRAGTRRAGAPGALQGLPRQQRAIPVLRY